MFHLLTFKPSSTLLLDFYRTPSSKQRAALLDNSIGQQAPHVEIRHLPPTVITDLVAEGKPATM